jgi:hypothetical protein
LCASVSIFLVYIEPQLTLYGSTVDRDIPQEAVTRLSKIFRVRNTEAAL